MPDGKHCPACGVDIGVWPIYSAGLPNRIRCPRCKARVAYRETGPVLCAALLVLAAVTAGAWFVAESFEGYRRLIAFAVVMGVGWQPIELVLAWYLRANKVLEHRSGGMSGR